MRVPVTDCEADEVAVCEIDCDDVSAWLADNVLLAVIVTEAVTDWLRD